jgi:hypothetical protein
MADNTDKLEDFRPNFHRWWAEMVDREAPTIAAKAAEYGSNSLAQMGHLFARAQGRGVTEAEALEIGSFIYAYGKLQRVGDSILHGKLPSTDTWKDLSIYSSMSLYIREHGQWP